MEENKCGEGCACQQEVDTQCKCKETISKLKSDYNEMNDKYLRLYADFDNYKKRASKEREDAIDSTKTRVLASVLDIDSDLQFAKAELSKTQDENAKKGLMLIIDKFSTYLRSQGIEEIQTDKYDSDLHEVVTMMPVGEEKIVDVISKGYTLNGKVIRYPKIILGTV